MAAPVIVRDADTDDDGTGNTGTVHNNTWKTAIYNRIDAVIAALYALIAGPVPSVCEGRLTLTTGVPVTTADVTGATSIYFTPFRGNRISLYDGSSAWVSLTFTEKTLALGTLTNDLPYDVFAYNNSGVVALELLAWTSKTARATALVLQDGVLVKTGATTRRYLGTFHTTATTMTEDSAAKRLLWNYYNRTSRVLRTLEATDSWTYTTATLRQARATASNQVEAVVGVAEVVLALAAIGIVSNSGAGVLVVTSIGIGSTSATGAGVLVSTFYTAVAGAPVTGQAQLTTTPPIGYQFYPWLEYSAASGTSTWYGDNGGTGLFQAGIRGRIEG